jgi:hypothetical protein
MSRLKKIRIALLPSPSNITSAPEASWTPLGLGKDVLLRELEALYWEGVRGELENILRTLNTWDKPDFSSVRVDDEDDDFIHGFDTFIDQVTEESRAFAIRYGKAPHGVVRNAFQFGSSWREELTEGCARNTKGGNGKGDESEEFDIRNTDQEVRGSTRRGPPRSPNGPRQLQAEGGGPARH